MGTTKSAFEKRERIKRYVKEPGEQSRTKKETIGWAIITLGITKQYAEQLVEAFIDAKVFKEHEGYLI